MLFKYFACWENLNIRKKRRAPCAKGFLALALRVTQVHYMHLHQYLFPNMPYPSSPGPLSSPCLWLALLLQVPDIWRGRNLKISKPFIEIKQGTRRRTEVRVEMRKEGKKGSQRMLGALCTEWQPCTLFLSVLQSELSKMTTIVIGAFPSGFRCFLILKPHWKLSFLTSELSALLIIF